jgi:hypothetical protein
MPPLRRPEKSAAADRLRWCKRFVLLCAIASTTLSPAQTPADGAIHGIVVDAGDHALRLAEVTAKSLDTPSERKAQALRDGTFLIVSLPPGEYALHIRFGASNVDAAPMLTVNAGETAEVRVKLVGAGVAQATQLLGEALAQDGAEPDEDADGLSGARGLAVIQGAAVLDGISATQTYGAVPVGAGSNSSGDPYDDPGAAEATTGPNHGLARGRHAGVAYTYAQGSVREFRVGTESYSAQSSGASSVLNAVTRSGGDKLHGGVGFHLRSSALAARSPLAVATSYANGIVSGGEVKPHDLRENAAFEIGGPLRYRGRGPRYVNFFYAFDTQRRGFPAISSPADPNFYNLTAIQTDLLANRGVSASQLRTALAYLSSLTGETSRRADQTINFGRLDWKARPRLALGLQYNGVRWNSPAGLLDAPVVPRGRASLGNAAGSADQALLRVSPEWSGRTMTELRLAYTRDLQYETPQTPLPQEPAIGPAGLSPEVNIGPNGLLFGTPASLSQIAYPDEQRYEAGETLTVARGHHLLQLGGSFAYVRENVATLANAAGTFRYDSGATKGKAGGLVDFITDSTFNVHAYPNGGCPSIAAADHLGCFRSYTQSFGQQRVGFLTREWSGFLEDSWRPSRRLMLHAGVRYEYTRLPRPQHPNPALDVIFGAQASTSIFPDDRKDLGPRASFTLEPFGHGRVLLKVGYGVYFGHLPGATIQAALTDTAQPSSTVKIRITPSAVVNCPQVAMQGFGFECSFTSMPTGVAAATTSAVAFDRQFRLPVVQQGSFAIEGQLRRGTSLSVGFVANEDRQLPNSTDLNIAPSTQLGIFQLQGGTGRMGVQDGETFVLPVYTARVSSSYGPVTDIVSNVDATFHGLVVKLDSRLPHGLQAAATYTWSKAIDFGQSSSATPRTNGQLDPFLIRYDKGLSSLNYPQALHADVLWAPQLEGARRMRRLADGWSLAAISTARSGRPYSYDLSGGPNLPGGHESLNGSGGAQYLPTVGRNTLRLPMTINTNVRVARGFQLFRTARGLLSAEAFNVFNHQSVTSVNQRAFLVGTAVDGVTPLVFQSAQEIATEGLNTTAFGTPNATGSSLNRERQIELALRIAF